MTVKSKAQDENTSTKSKYSVGQGHWSPGVMNNSGRNIVVNENLMMQGTLHCTYLENY